MLASSPATYVLQSHALSFTVGNLGAHEPFCDDTKYICQDNKHKYYHRTVMTIFQN